MKRMNRIGLGLALLGFAGLVLAGGCARNHTQEDGVVTLRMVIWGTPKDEAALNEMMEVFMEENPNIRVRIEITPHARVFDKLLISFAGGRAPDVSRVSSLWFYPLAAKGVLQDLTPFIEEDQEFDISDFYETAVKGWGTYDKRVHALPTDLDLTAMYYNKRLFDKHGLSYPDETWDWEKYLEVAEALTKDTDGDGKIDQWGSTTDGFWQSYVYQNGGMILNEDHTRCMLDQPEAYEAIQFMADLRQKHRVVPSPADTADIGQIGLWASGRIGMYFSGSWAAGLVFKDRVKDFEWDVAPVPKGRYRATFMGGSAFAMMSSSKHKKEAWELVKFMTSPYVQARWAKEQQVMPSRKSVAKSGAFLDLDEPPANRRVFIEAAKYGRTLPSVYSTREMNDIISNYISLALLGRATAKEVCLDVTPKVNDLLRYDEKREQASRASQERN